MAEQKDLFTRLKKLFSTDVIVRNVGGKKLKVIDTDAVQYATDKNSLRDRFNRLRSSTYNLHNRDMSLSYQSARLELFRDYDVMDMDPILSSALDIYADECLVPSEFGNVLTINSKDESIKKILENLFYDIMNIEFNLWSWTRNMPVKYDSVIPLLNGENISIEELSNKVKSGEEVWVHSIQDKTNKVVPGKVTWCDKNYTSNTTTRVTFDDGGFVETAPEHPFLLRDGHDKRADQLNLGDSLMPFYRKLSEKCSKNSLDKYETVYDPSVDGYEFSHRIVAKELGIKTGDVGKVIHHKDFDKYNNSQLHSKHNSIRSNGKKEMWNDPVRRERAQENMKLKWNSKLSEIFDFHSNIPKDEIVSTLQKNDVFMVEWNSINTRKFKRIPVKSLTNHKVSSIETISESADMYCMTVVGPNGETDRHNFPICGKNSNGTVNYDSGVFVKNCKYGDFFLKLELSPEYGVYTVRPLSAYEITRIEGSDPTNINYVKYQHDGLSGGSEYENFEIAHFRLISDSNFLPYGKSMLEGARRVWKQLSLMEDAMLIHRIMRAPEKRIFKIDVGNIPPNEIDGFMQKIMNQIKKVPYLDERTGDYNLRFNLNNMVEDFYLPVRGGDSGTSIDTLPGMEFTGTEDIEYVRNKMMAALKIPKAFLGYEEGISGKATLAAEDVRFSRTIARLQRIIVSELSKIAVVHLYIQGYTDASLVDFTLELTNPSTIFEQEKIAIWQDKLNVSKDMIEAKLFSRAWVYHNVFNMSETDVEQIQSEVIDDQKAFWRMQQIEEEGNDPMKSNQAVDADGGIEDVGVDEPTGSDLEPATPPDSPPEEAGAGLPDLTETVEEKDAPPIEEDKDRDQTGNKEKYSTRQVKNRGEDPLGSMENKAKTTSNPLKHTFRGGSPLSLDEELKRLKATLGIKFGKKEKQVITEKKSILDESNLLGDDKAE